MQKYSFTTKLYFIDNALMKYILVVPTEILEQLPDKSRIRVKGTINDFPFTLSILSLKDGRKYFAASAELRKKSGLINEDSVANISFHLIDENVVEIPEEFKEVLLQDEKGSEMFYELPMGIQRSLMHYIISAKTIDTKIKRSFYLIEKIKRGELETQKRKESKSIT